jgi:uncharacterized membrane protein
MKSQFVRLIDVFLLGPFMVMYPFLFKNKSECCKDNNKNNNDKIYSITIYDYILIISGILTILYNGYNYFVHNCNYKSERRNYKFRPLPF